jgi:hypothetical protein
MESLQDLKGGGLAVHAAERSAPTSTASSPRTSLGTARSISRSATAITAVAQELGVPASFRAVDVHRTDIVPVDDHSD